MDGMYKNQEPYPRVEQRHRMSSEKPAEIGRELHFCQEDPGWWNILLCFKLTRLLQTLSPNEVFFFPKVQIYNV